MKRSLLIPVLTVIALGTSIAQETADQLSRLASAAREAEQRGDYSTAVRSYEKLVRLVPQVPELYANLGLAYHMKGDFEAAQRAFLKALLLNPKLTVPKLFLGIEYYLLSRADEAVPYLEKAVDENPADVVGRKWLAQSYTEMQQYGKAIPHLLAAVARAGNDPEMLFLLGENYLSLSVQAASTLSTVSPKSPFLLVILAEKNLAKGDPDTALHQYRMALEKEPGLADAQARVAAILTQKGDRTQQLMPQAAPSKPPDAERSVLVMARAALSSGAAQKAVGKLASVGPASKQYDESLYLRSRAYGDLAGAAFEQLQKIAPDSFWAHVVNAKSLAAREETDMAIEEYVKALKKNPNARLINLAIGNLYWKNVEDEQAVKYFEAELQVNPHNATAHYALGHAYLETLQADRALPLLRKALELRAPAADIHRDLGKLYLSLNQPAKAVPELEACVRLVPDDRTAFYQLFRAYKAVGQDAKAQQALLRFKDLDEATRAKSGAETRP